MIEVSLYPNGYPWKCAGTRNYSKVFIEAGKPKYIDYEHYTKRDFIPTTQNEISINNYLNTEYCLNK